MPDVARRIVGRYEILRELGRSGASTVYLARQTDLDRCVALKALHATGLRVATRESQVVGSLSHPNIVTIIDSFARDGVSYYAMEYVERGSLRPFVGRMTLAQIGGVLEGVLAALRHAEKRRIVHRDLRPEKLMVTADGRVKIVDFGIVKATAAATLTVTGVTVGTTGYMAPEQATGAEIGPWTDLYSVGCIAFELLTGRTPFDGSEAPMATLLRHVNEPIPPVRSLVPDVGAELSDWVERLLVKEPAWRTRSAAAAWAELEEILVRRLGPLWRRQAPLEPERSATGAKRRSWAVPAAIGAGIAAVAGVSTSALGTEGRVDAPQVLAVHGIALEVPADWRRDPGAGIAARGPDGQRIVAGWTHLPSGRRVRAVATRGGGRVLRYDGVRIAGRPAVVYAAPTTKDAATVTCFATERACSAIGTSLRVSAGELLPLGPDPAFIAGVGRVLGWLEARERPLAAALRRPGTRAGRVAITKKLWWTYAGASKRLRRLDAGPADVMTRRRLVEALRLAGCAYGRAAGHRDRAGYAREGELALVHQAGVRRALDALRDAGYALPPAATGAARFTRLPPLGVSGASSLG